MQNQTFKQAIVAMAAGILGLMSGSVGCRSDQS